MNFNNTQFPPLYFGAEALSHVGRIAALYGRRAMLIHGSRTLEDKGVVDRVFQILRGRGVRVIYAKVTREPTTEDLEGFVMQARTSGVEVVVAMGGGAAIDAGKAVAALAPMLGFVVEFIEGIGTRKPSGECLPWIAIPTTAGTGSEASTNAVLKGVGPDGIPFKRSIRHPNYLPKAILIDAELQIGMPRNLTVACAMDAFSQLLESYTSIMANPMTDAVTLAGLKHMAAGIELLHREDSLAMREHFALAALYSGFGLANAGLGLVHGVAGLIGAMRDIPHGVVCGTLVAPAFEYTIQWLMDNPCPQSAVALQKFAQVGQLFGHPDATALPGILHQLVSDLQIPRLGEYGFTDSDLQEIAQKGSNRSSPATLSAATILEVLRTRR